MKSSAAGVCDTNLAGGRQQAATRRRYPASVAGLLATALLVATRPGGPSTAAPFGPTARACRVATNLSFEQARSAAREGGRFADRHEGYGVASWVLFQSPDPLRAEPNRAGVDAVIVETPFERIRNASYLLRYQGEALPVSTISRMRRETANTIGFIVYAHSRGEHDRGFMGAYSRATIALTDGRRLVAKNVVRFGPSSDFYTVQTFRDIRWTGSLTYRFTLPPDVNRAPCNLAGTLYFADGHGRSYAHPFRLANYR